MTLTYTAHATRIGELLLLSHNAHLVKLAFATENFDQVLNHWSTELDEQARPGRGDLGAVASELDEYFAGQRTRFTIPVALPLSTPFRRSVLDHLATIPYGHTQSYTQVAGHVGRPRAVRAVGSACATNPVPIILPCHRVLTTGGTLGGYSGGLATKTLLLELEK